MKKLEWVPGTRLERIARELVLNAPACTSLNGIQLRAKYPTTNPRDIVARYRWLCVLRSINRAAIA